MTAALNSRPLRPYQTDAIDKLRSALSAGKHRPMLMAPTGSGKTRVAAEIIRLALGRGKRVVFTIPFVALVNQTLAAFEAEGIAHIGVLQADHPRRDDAAPVQVASLQTIARRGRPLADLVIVDEAHRIDKGLFQWMREAPSCAFIGLSATPWASGLGRQFDDLIIVATTADLIAQGYLSKFQIFAPSEPDLSRVRIVAGDFHEGQLAEAVNTPTLVGDVVDEWMKRAKGLPTLAYGVNRKHAQHIAQRFAEAGIACEYCDANTSRDEREEIFDRFRLGKTKVIANVATLAVGVDLDVRCLIDARPTRSEMLYVQTLGRGLRTAAGKDRLIVLDHAGNAQRLGLPDQIHHDRLDDGRARRAVAGKRPREAVDVRLCPECAAVMPRGKFACAECGHEIEARTEVQHADGELVELGSAPRAPSSPSRLEQAEFFAELKGHAADKGYATGWAAYKFRERFGQWPNDAFVRLAEPRPPSLKTRNWIISRQIAFARRRAHG